MAVGCLERTIRSILHYETIKIVDIKNKKLGAVFRLIQFLILAYVIGYVIVYKKGYQEKDYAISTVTTKLKGSTFIDFGNFSTLFNGIKVYDSSDYVVPPQETNSFFVMTNMIITPSQTQTTCPENIELKSNWCEKDEDCQPALKMVTRGNGVRTGSCVYSRENSTRKVCEIYGWCPTEIDSKPMHTHGYNLTRRVPLLDAAKDFTVLIKNQIIFPQFGIRRRNIIGYKNRNALRHCMYSKENSPICPIFRLGDIIHYCGDNFTDVAYRGGLYGIFINWDCDFDHNVDKCIPVYDFKRLDDPESPLSRGYNFRYSQYFVVNERRYRTLTKAFGIKFYVLVYAKAGRFSPIPLFVNIGAGFALLVLANICCDLIVLYCMKRRKVYGHYKFETIDDSGTSSADEQEETIDKKRLENNDF